MGYSLFQTPTLGMLSQTHALNTLGTNIANISTGGFKRTDTRFATVLGGNIRTGAGSNSTISYASPNGAFGGVRPKDFQTLDQQGILKATSRELDLAIAGDGFFIVSPTLQVSSKILYTRDGSFEINIAGAPVPAIGDDGNTISVREGFLTDKNGFFLLGMAPEADGTFLETAALQALRVDQFAFTNVFSATTSAILTLNLPGEKKFGEPDESLSINLVDSNGKVRAITASFVKTSTALQWQMVLSGDNVITSTLSPSAPLVFNSKGTLTSPTSVSTSLTFSDGATSSFTFDISRLTQFAGAFLLTDFSQNGLSSSNLKNVTFDQDGNVIGQFKDGTSRKIYKLPLASFSNPNGLQENNGNVYEETSLSGSRRTIFADTSGIALLAPNTVELANVDLATQFIQMIKVQNAYNSSATVFKTVDEMLKAARDLKA